MITSDPASYWVRIHLPTGLPGGLRVVEKSNWAGHGAMFSRAVYPAIRGHNDFDFDRTGVYVLWESPTDAGALPRVYIGEADPLRPRLDQHMAQKDFWTSGVAFSAKDYSLNKAHVRHLESLLIQRAKDLKRCRLENGNTPRPPSLSSADKTLADAYLRDMMLCLPVLGIDFFESSPAKSPEFETLYVESSGVRAQGHEDASGFVVRGGSQVRKTETATIHRYMSTLRQELKGQGLLRDAGKVYEFSGDYTFSSPSTAAGVVLGRAANGRTIWKDARGRTLKELQEQRLSE